MMTDKERLMEIIEETVNQRIWELVDLITTKDITYKARLEELRFIVKDKVMVEAILKDFISKKRVLEYSTGWRKRHWR